MLKSKTLKQLEEVFMIFVIFSGIISGIIVSLSNIFDVALGSYLIMNLRLLLQ